MRESFFKTTTNVWTFFEYYNRQKQQSAMCNDNGSSIWQQTHRSYRFNMSTRAILWIHNMNIVWRLRVITHHACYTMNLYASESFRFQFFWYANNLTSTFCVRCLNICCHHYNLVWRTTLTSKRARCLETRNMDRFQQNRVAWFRN